MALVRLSEAGEDVVAKLAETILSLVEQLRDEGLRADLAEAALDAELQKIGVVRDTLAGLEGDDPARLPKVLREVAEVLGTERAASGAWVAERRD